MLWGPVGTGKTCIAALMYGHRPKNTRTGWFQADTLFRQLAAARANPESKVTIHDQYGEQRDVEFLLAWDQIRNADFLVIDDIGTVEPSPAQSSIFTEILTARAGKKTVFTTNLNRSQLEGVFDARHVSRLFAGNAVQLLGSDRRIEGGNDFWAAEQGGGNDNQ